MADDSASKPNKFERPPTALVQRKAKIQVGAVNTLRFPGDLQHDDPGAWFNNSAPLRRDPTDKNDIRFLVDGETAIYTMFDAVDAASSESDYVLMLNWFVDPFISVTGKADCLGELLAKKLKAGVKVRAMFWRIYANYLPWPFHSAQNEDMVNFLNRGWVERDGKLIQYLPKGTPAKSRRNGAAVFDGRLNRISVAGAHVSVGSHHQKILVVKAGGALTAFAGGIDFNPDRLIPTDATKGSPLHDVHLRIVGPTCANLVKNFVERWTDHPDARTLDVETGTPLAIIVQPKDSDPGSQSTPPGGRHKVQMGRTCGAGPLMIGNAQDSDDHYHFAPAGDGTARALISNAISNAKKFIFLEDQYFVSLEAARLIAKALAGGLKHVTIVTPHHKIGDLPMMLLHRYQCFKIIRDADPSGKRARFFYKCGPGEKPGDYHTYVHSKMTIIDDEFAVVGSVNYNRRSWYYDTEMNLGIYDPSTDKILTNRFAHWLRMRMWCEHLFGTIVPPSPPDGGVQLSDCNYAEMFDGVAAGAQWVELIELQKSWQKKNPGKSLDDYNQADFNSVASVRPYNLETYDPSQEILVPGSTIPIIGIIPRLLLDSDYGWDHFLDPMTT
jgi:phosphatidylserine/phosphatidylglycerophosphate/cardiolipin synthase-like enzyme